jgi:hypothetical protein
MLVATLAIFLSACATTPYPEEAKIGLDTAMIQTAQALNDTGQYVKDHHLHVYGLRPARATVSFNLALMKERKTEAKANASATGGSGSLGVVLGWSTTRRITEDNHIEIIFTPAGK